MPTLVRLWRGRFSYRLFTAGDGLFGLNRLNIYPGVNSRLTLSMNIRLVSQVE